MKKFLHHGFTLLELMITLVIVGILSAIAYPSYQEQILKSRRAQAQVSLMSVAMRQQQFLLDSRSYASNLSDLGVALPSSVSPYYELTLAVTNSSTAPPSFTATATPLGTQLNDPCASLTVDQSGAKTPANCW
jgi:type IV pilus assembly protein PilE